jgi:uncharacterized protein (TIGR02217 family)
MSFFECEFPRMLSYRAVGGPGFSTVVNEGFSGYEQRNRNWSQSRAKWVVSLQTPTAFAGQRMQFIDLLESFFLNVGGKADAFRLFDHKDHWGVTQPLGTGNGSTRVFQVQKTYTTGTRSYVRPVKKLIGPPATDYQGKPLALQLSVFLNGVLDPGANYTVDCTTGLITFNAAPAAGVAVTASFQYHYPVRLDTDDMAIQVEESSFATTSADGPLVSWGSITLTEVRL